MTSAMILTGGASTRMGRDKATLLVKGETLAARVARVVRELADPVIVVGPEAGTGTPALDDPRAGPLVAVSIGAEELSARGASGPTFVVAADLPFLDAALLRLLERELGFADAAVPVAGDRDQPLCACYDLVALGITARRLVNVGGRSMRDLVAALRRVQRVPEEAWRAEAGPDALIDVDTPEAWEAALRKL
jgi:molybdopterin-guanine dinucleotide biosynthesis protein A